MGTIGSVMIGVLGPYPIYGSLAEAKTYLGAGYPSWGALTTDDARSTVLVRAQRAIDAAVQYAGVKTVATQLQQWPRTGVTNCDGVTFASTDIPQDVINAEYEMAEAIAADPSSASAIGTGSNIQSLTAGPVNVTYFSSTQGNPRQDLPLPNAVLRLLSCYLGNASVPGADGSAYASGFGCGKSAFDDCAQYTIDGPLV